MPTIRSRSMSRVVELMAAIDNISSIDLDELFGEFETVLSAYGAAQIWISADGEGWVEHAARKKPEGKELLRHRLVLSQSSEGDLSRSPADLRSALARSVESVLGEIRNEVSLQTDVNKFTDGVLSADRYGDFDWRADNKKIAEFVHRGFVLAAKSMAMECLGRYFTIDVVDRYVKDRADEVRELGKVLLDDVISEIEKLKLIKTLGDSSITESLYYWRNCDVKGGRYVVIVQCEKVKSIEFPELEHHVLARFKVRRKPKGNR
jgi:hypothetical protein